MYEDRIDDFLNMLIEHYYGQFQNYYVSKSTPENRLDFEDSFQDWCYNVFKKNYKPPFDKDVIQSEISAYNLNPFDYFPSFIFRWLNVHRRFFQRKSIAKDLRHPKVSIEAAYALSYELPEIEEFPLVVSNALQILLNKLNIEELNLLLTLKRFPENSQSKIVMSELGISSKHLYFLRKSRLFRKLRDLKNKIGNVIKYLILGYSVFISSTYNDLKEHRKEVLNTLHKLAANGLPIVIYAMEYIMTMAEHPGNHCLKLIRNSDEYIGIFGATYGSIWSERGVSFTEAELKEAEDIKIKRSIYLSSPEHRNSLLKESDPKKSIKIRQLEEYLKNNYIVEFFDSPIHLARSVAERMSISFLGS